MTASQDAAAWLDQYVTDACAAAVAPVQAALDDSNAGVKDRDAIIAGLQQRISDLQAQLAACQNAQKPTPQPTPPAMLVGARGRETDTVSLAKSFEDAQAKIGPLQVTRVFEGALPPTHVPFTPDGVVEIVSCKSASDANIASFVPSMRPGTLVAEKHEIERPTYNLDGATWRKYFMAQQAKYHAAGTSLGMISAGYQYRAGQRGYDGSFIVPEADWFAIDTYRDGSSENGFGAIVPLEQVDEFQRWLSFVQPLGKPMLVTEYGRGTVSDATHKFGEVASTPAKRAAVLAQDVAYLQSLGFFAVSYWYSNVGPDNRSWAFTDQASIDAFRALPRG